MNDLIDSFLANPLSYIVGIGSLLLTALALVATLRRDKVTAQSELASVRTQGIGQIMEGLENLSSGRLEEIKRLESKIDGLQGAYSAEVIRLENKIDGLQNTVKQCSTQLEDVGKQLQDALAIIAAGDQNAGNH